VRTYPEHPIVSVGAVILDGDRVLLVKRGHEPLKGEWSLPGGVVEIGETLAEALRREVLEETGLEVHVGPLIEVLDRVHRAPDERVEYHFVILDYLCRVGGGRLAHSSDAADASWVDIGDLGQYRLTEKAASVVHKALEMSRRTA
jgi:mutator protein MutT